MSPQEKAKAGVWLLKQAVLEFLASRPNRAGRPDDIREALHLCDEDSKGQHKGYLLWGLENLLKKEGVIETEKIDGYNHVVLIDKSAC
jgi:hypothetical protein